MVTVRPIEARDAEVWSVFRGRLWPDADTGELLAEALAFTRGADLPIVTAAFIAEEAAVALGFIELSVRAFSDGCESRPVPHVEGWYVERDARGRGIGRALIDAAESWARQRGFKELASDSELHNVDAQAAHLRCGFFEAHRLVKFRKPL
jgi:aminoglycoside 6'-N-acetyltransferase I